MHLFGTLQLGSREAIQCKKDNHEWCPRIIHFLTGWFPRVAIREERWERMELLIAWRNSPTNLTQRTRNQSWESFVYILRRNSAIWAAACCTGINDNHFTSVAFSTAEFLSIGEFGSFLPNVDLVGGWSVWAWKPAAGVIEVSSFTTSSAPSSSSSSLSSSWTESQQLVLLSFRVLRHRAQPPQTGQAASNKYFMCWHKSRKNW